MKSFMLCSPIFLHLLHYFYIYDANFWKKLKSKLVLFLSSSHNLLTEPLGDWPARLVLVRKLDQGLNVGNTNFYYTQNSFAAAKHYFAHL